MLETALNEEMTEHLGHEKNQAAPDRESTNVRNGTRPKTVISDAAGEVGINVPRDRKSTFEPRIVKKRQRRLTEVDEIVLSLYAKGMTTGDTEVERLGSGHGGSASIASPVWARNPSMRSGRYWMRLSRFFTMAARWSTPSAARLPSPFFMFAHTPSAGLSSGA